MKPIFIGVAWPYANGPLHLGHIAGCYLPADIFARFSRIMGWEVLMVSGSDQHGTPITIHAEEENTSAEKIAERYHKRNKTTLKRMEISFDIYTKTHREEHFKVVQDVFLTLKNKGYVYLKMMEAPYCPKCKRFLPDRYVEGTCPYCGYPHARGDQCDNCGRTLDPKDLIDMRCKICGSKPILKDTEHFYLKLSNFEDQLLGWVKSKDKWRANTYRQTMSWLNDGLKDRAITRDITWGVPIPIKGYENKRIYVWFDAVCGYLSATKEWAEKEGKNEEWKRFWFDNNVKHVYFLAKDNIPFHTIIWPAMLMGYSSNYHLPDDIPANEYLKLGEEQFSKSRGNALWVDDLLKFFTPDQLRFYLSYIMPENRDAVFDMKEFVQVINTELVGNVGNFIHRAVTFTATHFGVLPKEGYLSPSDKKMIDLVYKTYKEVEKDLETYSFKGALRRILELSHEANRYFSSEEPWKLIKEDRERCGTVLSISLRVVKSLLMMLSPYIPDSIGILWKSLTYKEINKSTWEDGLKPLSSGMKVNKTHPPFEKVQLPEAFDQIDINKEEVKEGEVMTKKEEITIEEFFKTELVVGKILNVLDHPKADKLYILKVDIGEERRQLVAGLKGIYSPEELRGKLIIVVKNLKPAKLRGEISEGMLLAAEDEEGNVVILTPEKDIQPGSRIR